MRGPPARSAQAANAQRKMKSQGQQAQPLNPRAPDQDARLQKRGWIRDNVNNRIEVCSGLCWMVFLFLWTIPILFAFIYHEMPTAVLVVVLTFFVGALSPASAGSAGALLAGGLTACVLASTMGSLHCYYAYVHPLRELLEGRTYSGVYANQQAVAFSDASVLSFAGNATVDDTQAVGMTTLEGGVSTYCVAPIMDSGSVGRVEFWAAGVDCCGKLANFDCDSAGNATVHDGFVIPDPSDGDPWYNFLGKHLSPPIARRDLFMKAIKRAETIHSVTSSANPVLVKWVGKSKDQLAAESWAMILIAQFFLLLLAGGFAMIAAPAVRKMREAVSAALMRRAERAENTVPQQFPATREANAIAFRQVCLEGIVLPLMTVLISLIMWSFSDCLRIRYVHIVLIIMVLVAMTVTLFSSQRSLAYGVLLLLAAIAGSYVGRWNYVQSGFFYCSTKNHQVYDDVSPVASANEYGDAGGLIFQASAGVARNQSSAFRYRGVNYCAAPVISSGSPPPAPSNDDDDSAPANASIPQADSGSSDRVDFWVVGKNCCAPRGSFDCGAVDDPDAHSGIVLRDVAADSWFKDPDRLNYMSAIRSAATTYNLMAAEEPILMLWGKDLEGYQQAWLFQSYGVLVVGVAVTFLLLGAIVPMSLWWAKQNLQARQ